MTDSRFPAKTRNEYERSEKWSSNLESDKAMSIKSGFKLTSVMFFLGFTSEITDSKRESIELRSDAAENAEFRGFAMICRDALVLEFKGFLWSGDLRISEELRWISFWAGNDKERHGGNIFVEMVS